MDIRKNLGNLLKPEIGGSRIILMQAGMTANMIVQAETPFLKRMRSINDTKKSFIDSCKDLFSQDHSALRLAIHFGRRKEIGDTYDLPDFGIGILDPDGTQISILTRAGDDVVYQKRKSAEDAPETCSIASLPKEHRVFFEYMVNLFKQASYRAVAEKVAVA